MGIPNTYDNVFEKYRGSIPVSYLRSLAFSSSNMNPNKSVKGSAGLFMISESALKAFDKKFPNFDDKKGNHSVVDLTNPVLSTAVATWILKNIISYYASHYPKTLTENWNNPTYAALVTQGYYSGYTEPNGLGSAIKIIEEKSPNNISLENVAKVAKEIGLGPAKYDPKIINRSMTVANLYVADTGGKPPVEYKPGETATYKKVGFSPVVFLLGLPILGLLFMSKKK